jgi:hypothetical protein
MTHELKTWPAPFQAVVNGEKRYEIRSTYDRKFEVSDILFLREWDPNRGYTGRSVAARVLYITNGEWGIPDGLCVMSIEVVS